VVDDLERAAEGDLFNVCGSAAGGDDATRCHAAG
jgi:hypothetical protein